MSDTNRSNPTKRIDEVASLLFGEPEDLEEDELDETLMAEGIDIEESRNKLYERLRLEAQPYWMAQKDLPTALKQALEEFRPNTAPIRTEKELEKRAGLNVTRILNAARSKLIPFPPGEVEFGASFRNAKKEMSAADQETIDRLEKELLESIESEDDDHER
jgi:hypothetical protein